MGKKYLAEYIASSKYLLISHKFFIDNTASRAVKKYLIAMEYSIE